jgi:beta-galactosidase
LQGGDRVFLTHAGLVLDGDNLRLTSAAPDDLSVAIYPAPSSLQFEGSDLAPKPDGVFQRFAPRAPLAVKFNASFTKVRAAGPPREIPTGKIQQPVAAAPLDADFENAAVWRVEIPAGIDLSTDPLVRFHYVGDAARVLLDGKFIIDDFYNGGDFDIGLRRHAPDILTGDLRIAILPLRKDAPIYMAESARPDFGNAAAIAALQRIEIIPRYQLQLTTR